MYPVLLELRGVKCLVVGGGSVGTWKAEGLLAEGAEVTVVAPAKDMVISNTKVLSDTQGPAAGQHTVHFAPTARISGEKR